LAHKSQEDGISHPPEPFQAGSVFMRFDNAEGHHGAGKDAKEHPRQLHKESHDQAFATNRHWLQKIAPKRAMIR
jgi:hypothetical protein